jgi:PAT family beta-lactamase induction signal transducer AmpG
VVDTTTSAFTKWVRETFGEEQREASVLQKRQMLVGVSLSQPPVGEEPVILNMAFKNGDQSISLNKEATRFEFTRDNWDKQALMLVSVDPKLKEETTATFEGLSGNIPFAWLIVFISLSVFFFLASVYHYFVLPKPATDKPSKDVKTSVILREFMETFRTFFTKENTLVAILFMLLYRLP